MKFFYRSTSRRTRTPLSRLLAGLLSIGIVFSITLGQVHNHGSVYGPSQAGVAADSAVSGVPLHGQSDGHECLICLLQQQLFSSVVHTVPLISTPSTEAVFVTPATDASYSCSFTSTPIARLSGRAPPPTAGDSVVRVD